MKAPSTQVDQATYHLAKEGYLYELGLLIQLSKTLTFGKLLHFFSNYEKFLSSEKEQFLGPRLAERLLAADQRIDTANSSSESEKLFACANLAASCEIFRGWTIPVGELDTRKTEEYLQYVLDHSNNNTIQLGRKMSVRLNKADAVRVVQTLKLLGLFSAGGRSYKQLSLCASAGERDRHVFYETPHIIKRKPPPGTPVMTLSPPLAFDVKVTGAPDNVVIIDNDPALKSVYEELNTREKGRLCAWNMDMHEGLSQLSNLIYQKKQLQPRDLVVAFRLAPAAFPDIQRFLLDLGNTIDKSADFIATIGSGDTLTDFIHRLEVMDELEKQLRAKQMNPVRIKNYFGRNHREQHANPIHGLSQYASYETLYCKLDKEKLD